MKCQGKAACTEWIPPTSETMCTVPGDAVQVRPHRFFGAHVFVLDAQHGATEFNVFTIGFWSCFGPTGLYPLISSF